MERKIELIKFLVSEKPDLFKKASEIRQKVFCDEQKVSREEEFDGLDDISDQYIIKYEEDYVATARKRQTKEGIKLERFAVLKEYRGKGLASKILDFILKELENETKIIYLNAQITAMPLYSKFGFKKLGEKFTEADILHYRMELDR